jgi:hypothetical protein
VQVAMDGVDRHDQAVVMPKVPGDGVWPVVKPFAGQFLPKFDDQVDGRLR